MEERAHEELGGGGGTTNGAGEADDETGPDPEAWHQPRFRSHYRFRNRGIEYVSEFGI